jgi:nucleoside 2-deoxyribosyltransferase/predicted secreted protein
MYLLVCPCIRDPTLRATGITHDRDRVAFDKFNRRCEQFSLKVRYLPCLETQYLGRERSPGSYSQRLDTPQFRTLLDSSESEVRRKIVEDGVPYAIIGVDSSPTCGVNTTYRLPDVRDAKRGAFLSRFDDILAYDVFAAAAFRVYLAGPLFSEAERQYNIRVAELLRSYAYDVYLPQETGDSDSMRGVEAHREIFAMNREQLDASDIVVAIIDGSDADSGTAWEMGYAYAKGIPVYAVRTDFRIVGDFERVNLMLEQSATVVSRPEHLPGVLPCALLVSVLSSGNEQDNCGER